MLTFSAFTGINNVVPEHRLGTKDLVAATNVDIGLTGEVSRRDGFRLVHEDCHKNLAQAQGFMLATVGPQLTAIWPDGTRNVIHPALGADRVWYCNLPDGRTTFSNGLIHGVTDGHTGAALAVPAPASLGVPDAAFGDLHPGEYRYSLSYTRVADRLEGPAVTSPPVTVGADGGLRIDALPVLADHEINIYLSGKSGEGAYLAGATTDGHYEINSANTAQVVPCRTLGADAMPVGTITAFWRGRLLVAKGSMLWASRPSAMHICDWADFKQLPAAITCIVPVDDGIYVGTEQDLAFLGGTSWGSLTYTATMYGPVVLGSGLPVRGSLVQQGNGTGEGSAMLCIAGGEIIAGFNNGQTNSLTAGRYKTTAKEVVATVREIRGIPQYMAVPQ